jgi:hypothetical protein
MQWETRVPRKTPVVFGRGYKTFFSHATNPWFDLG